MALRGIDIKQINGLEDYEKIKKQFLALYILLLQKGIFSETEIKELIDSIYVIEKMGENI